MFVVPALVGRKFDHSKFCGLCRRLHVPREIGLTRMRPGEPFHAFVGILVKFKFEAKGFGNRLVGNIIVSVNFQRAQRIWQESGFLRWSNSPTGNYEIIVVAHTLHSFNDLALVVCNDFDAFQGLPASQYIPSLVARTRTIPN
jgi:hypothetical protein